MSALHTQQLAAAPDVDPDAIVCRYDFGGAAAQRLITDGAGPGAAGPSGFELTAHRVAPAGKIRLPASASRQRVLVVNEGSLQLRGGSLLNGRCLALLDRNTVAELRNDGGRVATLLEITWVPRTGKPLGPGRRVARLRDMSPMGERVPFRWVPRPVHEFLSPRDLYTAMGPKARGPVQFRVTGPDELVVVFAHTPQGTGPALHVHKLTTEMFCVLSGRFEVSWGDHGEHRVELDRYDCVVLPRHASRAFKALTPDAWILPIVVGANDETEDIAWLDHVFEEARQKAPRMAALLSRRFVQVGRRP